VSPAGWRAEAQDVSYFLSREKVVSATGENFVRHWLGRLFAAMARNAAAVTDYFNLPTNRVVELGTRVEI
jgi:KUP system potassium uptake protein